MVFAPRYCCCAIPLVNVGMYALMTEQFIICCVGGVLAIATPTIVGSYVPTYTPYILAALCFVVAAIQLVGFFGIYREQIRTFRAYAWINAFAFGSLFVLGAALVGVSAARHGEAVQRCITTYFSGPTGGTINVSSEGESICKIFAWADIGIMGGIWLVLLIGQFYFIFMTKVYASEQKEDHAAYKSIYEANAEEFAMIERNSQWGPNPDAWDHRPSMESMHDRSGNEIGAGAGAAGGNMYEAPYSQPGMAHGRQYSESSLKREYEGEKEGDEGRYEYEAQGYPPQQGQGGMDYEQQQHQEQQYAQHQGYPQQHQQQGYEHQQYAEDDGRQSQYAEQYRHDYSNDVQGQGQAPAYHPDARQGGGYR